MVFILVNVGMILKKIFKYSSNLKKYLIKIGMFKQKNYTEK